MKTRIIKTRIWAEDEKFGGLSLKSKLGFIYYITNERIGMTGIYECPDRVCLFELGINKSELDEIRRELQDAEMVHFFGSWVFVVNAERHNNYKQSPKTLKAYEAEKKALPSHVLEHFDSSMIVLSHKGDSTPNTKYININTKTKRSSVEKPVNNKAEIVDKKGVGVLNEPETIAELKAKFPDIADRIDGELEKMKDWLAAEGKKKKNYIAFARNWLRKTDADFQKTKPMSDPKIPRFDKCPRCNEYHPAGACVRPSVFANRLFSAKV
jgi:hypothetical protein